MRQGIVILYLLAVYLIVSANAAVGTPFRIGGDPIVDANQFRITTYASGLDFPLSMQTMADGALLTGTSPGQLLRLVDNNGDGKSDGPGNILFSGLPGIVTSVRLHGNLAFVTSRGTGMSHITILRKGPTVSENFTMEGTLDITFPSARGHKSIANIVRDLPGGQPGEYELFFNVGSEANEFATTTTATINGLGLINVPLNADSIYSVVVDNTGLSPVVSNPTQIATGLRNAAGMAFHPITGDLYFEDNGIDTPGNRNEPLSADELNRIKAEDIGGTIEDFGFADNYIEYRTGIEIGSGGIDPLIAFQPLPAPNGSETEGPVEIAFAPAMFPAGLHDGIFVGFHGKGSVGLDNEENAFVFVDLTDKSYFHFINNDEPDVGPLDGVLSTNDSLFISDFRGGGDGRIYQIKFTSTPAPSNPVPEPSSLLLITIGIAGVFSIVRRQNFSQTLIGRRFSVEP